MARTDIRWSAYTECDWVTVSPSTGNGSTKITVSASNAQWYETKNECNVVFYNIDDESISGKTCIKRCVDSFDCAKLWDSQDRTIGYIGGTIEIPLNTGYLGGKTPSVLCNENWAHPSYSNGVITVTVDNYESGTEPRECYLTVTVERNNCKIKITQNINGNPCGCGNLQFEEITNQNT